MMLQGMTAQMLLRSVHRVKAGDTILIHAAAGGVGLIVCQWAKALGATVIGTVGSDEKAELARAHGCDHPIVYTRQDFVAEVNRITNGDKLPVVYDSVGRDTFTKSLDCLRRRGTDGELRQCVGTGRSLPAGAARAEGLALPDAPDALRLYRHARRARADRERTVRRCHERQSEDRDRAALPAQPSGRSARRAGRAQDHRIDRS